MVYEVNYGYVSDTLAADGAEIDAYVLNVARPLRRFEGCCIAILHRADDIEDKLVIVPDGTDITDADIQSQVAFQERFFSTRILR